MYVRHEPRRFIMGMPVDYRKAFNRRFNFKSGNSHRKNQRVYKYIVLLELIRILNTYT